MTLKNAEINNVRWNFVNLISTFKSIIITNDSKNKKLHLLLHLNQKKNITNIQKLKLNIQKITYIPKYIPTKNFTETKIEYYY